VADLRPLHSPFPGQAAQLVDIQCFTVKGMPADTPFTMSYTNPASLGYDLAYVLANQPKTGTYVPSPSYQANSSGAANQIHRQGIGSYLVKLPNLGKTGGHVQVTAEGAGPARCKVARWDPHPNEKDIKVICHTPSGKLVNSKFTLTYVRNGNLLGRPVGHPAAYAWANRPGASSYTPELIRQFTGSPSRITINRLDTGSYAVHVPGALRSGNVQVTAYGGKDAAHCKVNFWNPAGIQVVCFNTHGNHVDSQFTVSYVRP
jgi:hypothetical protein